MRDILTNIDGENLEWSILSLWATGVLEGGRSIVDSEEEILELPKGLQLSFFQLKDLSDRFEQIIDALIIGCEKIDNIYRYEDDQKMLNSCEFVIEMEDSTFWITHSVYRDQIERLMAQFKNTELIL